MIRIITVGKIKNISIRETCSDFTKRISRFTKIEVINIKESTKESEGKKILELTGDKKFIALHVDGKEYSSHQFSHLIKDSIDLILVIGNFNGLDETVLRTAHRKLSLSKMTLTHEHSCLFLLEQIYRGYTILNNLPYHK